MAGDIRDSKHLHNIGIDINAVAGAKVQSNNQLTPAVPEHEEEPIQSQNSSGNINTRKQPQQEAKKEKEETQEAPQMDVEQLKKEIYQTTTGQLQDLASQFQKFANRVNARLDELDKQLQRVNGSVSSQQTISAPNLQPKQEEKPKAVNKEDEYTSNDVSVDKIFNFSNTKGQSSPRPNN